MSTMVIIDQYIVNIPYKYVLILFNDTWCLIMCGQGERQSLGRKGEKELFYGSTNVLM